MSLLPWEVVLLVLLVSLSSLVLLASCDDVISSSSSSSSSSVLSSNSSLFPYKMIIDDDVSLSLVDEETGIGGIATLFVDEIHNVVLDGIVWEENDEYIATAAAVVAKTKTNSNSEEEDVVDVEVEYEHYIEYGLYVDDERISDGMVDITMTKNGNLLLPSSIDIGTITVNERGEHTIQVGFTIVTNITTTTTTTISKNTTTTATTTVMKVVEDDNDNADEGEEEDHGYDILTSPLYVQSYGSGISIIPLLVVLLLSLTTRMVEFSLFLALFVGSCMVHGNIKDGFRRLLDTYILNAIANVDNVYVVLFTLFLSGMVGMMEKSGGMIGFTRSISKYAKTSRTGQFVTFGIGIFIFFDDYANVLLAGETMKPLTDLLYISREKLAFIVDATSAPIASITPISSWVGFEVGLIQDEIDKLIQLESMKMNDDGINNSNTLTIETSGLAVFLQSIKYRYYPIYMMFFVIMLIITKRDLGPMLIAERKTHIYQRMDGGDGARTQKKKNNNNTGTSSASSKTTPTSIITSSENNKLQQQQEQQQQGTNNNKEQTTTSIVENENQPRPDQPLLWWNMVLPVFVLIFFIFYLLIKTGTDDDSDQQQNFIDKLQQSDSYSALLWGTMAAAIVTIIFYLLQIVKDGEIVIVGLGGNSGPSIVSIYQELIFGVSSQDINNNNNNNYDGGEDKGDNDNDEEGNALVSSHSTSSPRFLMSIRDSIDSFLYGMSRIFPALIVLTLAWSANGVMTDVGVDRLFTRWIVSGNISVESLPTLSFIISAFLALSTGTSWGTMAILMPLLLVPTYQVSNGNTTIFYSVVAGVLSGSVAGDHASPISDTTVLSSLACDCKLLSHVSTQAPYSLIVSIVSILLGTIPIGYASNWVNVIGIILGIIVLFMITMFICKPVISSTGSYDIFTQMYIYIVTKNRNSCCGSGSNSRAENDTIDSNNDDDDLDKLRVDTAEYYHAKLGSGSSNDVGSNNPAEVQNLLLTSRR